MSMPVALRLVLIILIYRDNDNMITLSCFNKAHTTALMYWALCLRHYDRDQVWKCLLGDYHFSRP